MSETIDNAIGYARDVVGKDPMATFLGITVEEVREGYARCSLTVTPDLLNAADRAHGSTVYAVADQAFAVASNSTGARALGMHFSISFIAAARGGETITAEATPRNIGRKTSVWQIDVRGDDGRLIANGEGIAYHK